MIGALLVHAVFLWGAVSKGSDAVGDVLRRLRLTNDDALRAGAYGAGQVIGRAERILVYASVAANVPALLPLVLGLKTIVRYPEVKLDAEQGDHTGTPHRRFAEYYLVGTLVSVTWAIGAALLARALVAYMGWTPPWS